MDAVRKTLVRNKRAKPAQHRTPETLERKDFPSLWHPNYTHDAIMVATGTLSQLLQHPYTAITEQDIEANSIALLAGASTNQRDLLMIDQIAQDHPQKIAIGKGWLPRHEVYHPNSPLWVVKSLGRGLVEGLGGDLPKAVKLMKTNPLFLKGIIQFADGIASGFYSHRLVGAKVIYLGAFGGNEVVQRVVSQRLAQRVRENWRVLVKFLPTPQEPLIEANARGELYRLIDRIATGLLPDNYLIVVKLNTQRSGHPDDDALINGITAITSTGPDGRESDSSNLLRLLRLSGCGFVEAIPRVVPIPLGVVGKRWLAWRQQWLVNIPEYDGSRMLEILLTKAQEILIEEPGAFYILTVSGMFTDQEIVDFKSGAAMLLERGHVVSVVNRMLPRIQGETGRWTMCAFRTAPELPHSVIQLFENSHKPFRGSGFKPEDFLALVPPPDEFHIAQQVAHDLERVAATV